MTCSKIDEMVSFAVDSASDAGTLEWATARDVYDVCGEMADWPELDAAEWQYFATAYDMEKDARCMNGGEAK